tara:strand:+ start:468 stop:932 length:465 start_codon:yes stop_codon:yes gene_type:complete
MKKLTLLLFIPLVFACSDDSNSDDVNLEIGDFHRGGIIFKVNPSGTTGEVVTMGDIGIMNWGEALSAAEDFNFQGYNDWYLPSIYELELMYNTIGQGADNIGDFADGTYWSSTYTGNNPQHASFFNFSNGNASNGMNPVLNCRVRFIRTFTPYD